MASTSNNRPPIELSFRARSTTSSSVRDLLVNAEQPGMISLAGGLPDASLFPVAELAELAKELIATDGTRLLQYGRTDGSQRVRVTLADHFELGDPDSLVVTAGSQQGLDLVVAVLFDPGDEVVVSDPEYLGLLQVLGSHGVRPIPIAADEYGLDVSVLEKRLASGFRPRGLYLVPHFHNPTGVTISSHRRARLHELSAHYGFVVIEDDPYRDLFHDTPPREVAADPECTIRLRTASKSLAPGLRVAVVSAPDHIREALIMAKQSADLHTGGLAQELVAQALSASWFAAHLRRLRASYHHKCEVLIGALGQGFGERISVNRPRGGMFLWADFGPGIDTAQWLASALERGVCFVPGAAFSVDRDLSSHVRLSFATADEHELHTAVERLASCMPGRELEKVG